MDTDRTLISEPVPVDDGSLTNTITRQESEVYIEEKEESTLTEGVGEEEKLDTATMRANLFRQGSVSWIFFGFCKDFFDLFTVGIAKKCVEDY